MVAHDMVARDLPARQVARDLGVDESTLWYHSAKKIWRPGRATRSPVGGDSDARVEAAVVHGVLRREFDFKGSYQAVRRHLARTYPALPLRAVRRVETPPGVQAQHEWFETSVRLAGVLTPIH